jgi:penicillin-binding protein 1A
MKVCIENPIYIKIEDKSGVVIYEPIPESHDVLNKDIAYAVIKLLEGVTEGGSGDRLRTTGGGSDNRWTGYPYSFRNPIAGKQVPLKTNLMVGSWEWFLIW